MVPLNISQECPSYQVQRFIYLFFQKDFQTYVHHQKKCVVYENHQDKLLQNVFDWSITFYVQKEKKYAINHIFHHDSEGVLKGS